MADEIQYVTPDILRTEIEAQDKRFDAKLDAQDKRFDAKLEAQDKRFDAKLEAQDKRFDARLRTELEAQDKRFDARLRTELEAQDKRFDAKLDAFRAEMRASMDALRTEMLDAFTVAVRGFEESTRAHIAALDDKYRDTPPRLTIVEARVDEVVPRVEHIERRLFTPEPPKRRRRAQRR
jgi:hypothetical protein